MMVNNGLNQVRNLMSSGTGLRPTIGVVGSFSFTPAASDSALTGSYFGDNFDSNTVTDKTNNYEFLVVATEANNATIYSAGIYNTNSVLFAEDTFVSLQKTGSMEVQFDINITYVNI